MKEIPIKTQMFCMKIDVMSTIDLDFLLTGLHI